MSNLHVIYRTCQLPNKDVERPEWMDNSGYRPEWYDKEKAFKSICNELDFRDNMHVLFDGYSDKHFLSEYENKKLNFNFKFLEFDGGSDSKSYKFCLEYIKNTNYIQDKDIVYLVEDDYFHKPGWKEVLFDAYLSKFTEYWTLFDHPDKYNEHPVDCKLYHSRENYWRTAESTTNTIAFVKETFLEHQDLHFESCDEKEGMTWDHSKFVKIKEKYGAEVSYPIPGWATHIDNRTLSPFVDWKKINETI